MSTLSIVDDEKRGGKRHAFPKQREGEVLPSLRRSLEVVRQGGVSSARQETRQVSNEVPVRRVGAEASPQNMTPALEGRNPLRGEGCLPDAWETNENESAWFGVVVERSESVELGRSPAEMGGRARLTDIVDLPSLQARLAIEELAEVESAAANAGDEVR